MTEPTETHRLRVTLPDGTVGPEYLDLTAAPGLGDWLAQNLAAFQAAIRQDGGTPPAFTIERREAPEGGA